MSENYWDKLMGNDEGASSYMLSYGEGPGSPLRNKLSTLVRTEDWVLDVGCGPGWNFDHFLQYGPAVYYRGRDYSERFIRVATQRVGTNVFEVGDARNLKEADGSFDVVILQDCVEHVNGYEKPVREALRVARRRVIVTFWHLTEDDDHININPEENDLDGWGAWYSQPKWEEYLNTLPVTWKHETLPRKDAKHDIYVLDKEQV